MKIPRNQQWLPDRFPQKHFLSFAAKCLPSNPILSAKRPDLKQSSNPTELRLKTFSELDYKIVTNSKMFFFYIYKALKDAITFGDSSPLTTGVFQF